jgi:ankyrin repeat protein
LIIAAREGKVEVVELLLSEGANIEATTKVFNTYVQVLQLFTHQLFLQTMHIHSLIDMFVYNYRVDGPP